MAIELEHASHLTPELITRVEAGRRAKIERLEEIKAGRARFRHRKRDFTEVLSKYCLPKVPFDANLASNQHISLFLPSNEGPVKVVIGTDIDFMETHKFEGVSIELDGLPERFFGSGRYVALYDQSASGRYRAMFDDNEIDVSHAGPDVVDRYADLMKEISQGRIVAGPKAKSATPRVTYKSRYSDKTILVPLKS